MQRVFMAAHSVEAHMILHLLEQSGISGHVEGEYLQGGVGDLPAGGLVHVVVDDEHAGHARAIIRDWESRAPPPAPARAPRFAPLGYVLLGMAFGGALVWIFRDALPA
jgi:hypothetical protein